MRQLAEVKAEYASKTKTKASSPEMVTHYRPGLNHIKIYKFMDLIESVFSLVP